MTKAESVLLLARERCSVAEIALGLRMRAEHVARIIRYGWWPWSCRRASCQCHKHRKVTA